jgi:hypothetical protein
MGVRAVTCEAVKNANLDGSFLQPTEELSHPSTTEGSARPVPTAFGTYVLVWLVWIERNGGMICWTGVVKYPSLFYRYIKITANDLVASSDYAFVQCTVPIMVLQLLVKACFL